MKIKVSIEAVGYTLWMLVGRYTRQNEVPATDVMEYLSQVPGMIARLKRCGDASYIRAALVQLVRKGGLNDDLCERLGNKAIIDVDVDEMRLILNFMLEQTEKELNPPQRDDLDVEFVRTGFDDTVWPAQREALNPGLEWHHPIGSAYAPTRIAHGQPCNRAGFWFTPAKVGSRKYFKVGDVMPEVGGDYGSTIWQMDTNQEPPKL
jgi:hypothetical protein